MKISKNFFKEQSEMSAEEIYLTLATFFVSNYLAKEFFEALGEVDEIHIENISFLKEFDWKFGDEIRFVLYKVFDYTRSPSPNFIKYYLFSYVPYAWSKVTFDFTDISSIIEEILFLFRSNLERILKTTNFDIHHEPRNLYKTSAECPHCQKLEKFQADCRKHACLLSYDSSSRNYLRYFPSIIARSFEAYISGIPATVTIKPSRANLLSIETEKNLYLLCNKTLKWFTYPIAFYYSN